MYIFVKRLQRNFRGISDSMMIYKIDWFEECIRWWHVYRSTSRNIKHRMLLFDDLYTKRHWYISAVIVLCKIHLRGDYRPTLSRNRHDFVMMMMMMMTPSKVEDVHRGVWVQQVGGKTLYLRVQIYFELFCIRLF